jgi:hypothetical protein
MKLYDNWKTIVKQAWSLRFMELAVLCEVAQVVLPMYTDVIPRDVFTVLIIFAVAGAYISRLVYQQNV